MSEKTVTTTYDSDKWQLVPKVLTTEMRVAYEYATIKPYKEENKKGKMSNRHKCSLRWEEMLKAAPEALCRINQ